MPKAYELPAPGEPFDPELFKLGKPCKRNHIHADGMTLRKRNGGYCILCQRIDGRELQRLYRTGPDHNRKAAASIAEKRKREGRPSRSKHGLPYTPWTDRETRAMRKSIRVAGSLPSVAKLVYDQQQAHWHTHLDDYADYKRLRSKLYARWKFMTDSSYRLYHRAKSKARKVAQRGGTPTHLLPTHLWQHWVRFDHRCAYCGCIGDLEIEHVVPISKGGQHHLGNIVPACTQCNSSKRSNDALQWYKTRSYYSEARWNKIQSVLQQLRPVAKQLSLIP
jgi:5-methylcytosine-specific restriction endonuclease McrA